MDAETVTRWLSGRIPHQRIRLAVADLLGETEAGLWPQTRPDLAPGGEATPEANSLVPGGSALVVDGSGWVLLPRPARRDYEANSSATQRATPVG